MATVAVNGSTAPIITLVPWDANSEQHIERMILQRKACGWKHEYVRDWAKMQKDGDISLFWIVVDDDEKIAQHYTTYPEEASPLLNTATRLDSLPVTPNTAPFVPIGHISLDSTHPEYSSMGNKAQGIYSINRFYISRALQSHGIGRATMDMLELMAVQPPIEARTLVLFTVAKEFEGRDEKLKAQGRKRPAMELEDWYSRRGFVVFDQVKGAWEEEDLVGRKWSCAAVFMRKMLHGGK